MQIAIVVRESLHSYRRAQPINMSDRNFLETMSAKDYLSLRENILGQPAQQPNQLLAPQQPVQPEPIPGANSYGNGGWGKGGKGGPKHCWICGVEGCYTWNHEGKGKGKGKGRSYNSYSGGWGNSWPSQGSYGGYEAQWQPEPAEPAPTGNEAVLLAQLRAKEKEVELMVEVAAVRSKAEKKEEMQEQEPARAVAAPNDEVVALKLQLQLEEKRSRNLAARMAANEAKQKEQEMESRWATRMQQQLATQKREIEQQFEQQYGRQPASAVAGLQGAVRSPTPVFTGGFAVRQPREMREEQEAAAATATREEQNLRKENEALKEKLKELERHAMPPPHKKQKEVEVEDVTEEEQAVAQMSDAELIANRTEELYVMSSSTKEVDGVPMKSHWQDLVVQHKLKKMGGSWPSTPKAVRNLCEKLATAEVAAVTVTE